MKDTFEDWAAAGYPNDGPEIIKGKEYVIKAQNIYGVATGMVTTAGDVTLKMASGNLRVVKPSELVKAPPPRERGMNPPKAPLRILSYADMVVNRHARLTPVLG